MNYNWQSAATPQGRERLKELGQKEVVAKITRHGIGHIEEIQADVVLKRWEGESVEFLDPSPQPQQPDDAPEGYHVVTFAKDRHPDENGLLPCPFCGGKAEIKVGGIGKYANYQVVCACEVSGRKHFGTKNVAEKIEQAAKDSWNRRA